MKYTFDHEDRFVLIRFSGLWKISKHSPIAENVLEECRTRNLDLLLIDFTGVENRRISLIERFRLGFSALAFIGRLRRIAVAARPDLLDRQRFGEMVARNRGVNIRAFTSLNEARNWLLEADSDIGTSASDRPPGH